MLPFLCCSTRYLIAGSLPTTPSKSESSLFIEVFDAFIVSINGLRPSSKDETLLLLSKNDDDVVVVVLEDAPVNLSKWSSSDDKSRLLAKGTELESETTEAAGILMSSSWALMVLMFDDVADGADGGDGDFFELFSKVLTEVVFGR